jgi:hypothetical protein
MTAVAHGAARLPVEDAQALLHVPRSLFARAPIERFGIRRSAVAIGRLEGMPVVIDESMNDTTHTRV